MTFHDGNGGERAMCAVISRVLALGLAVQKGVAGEE